MSESDIETLEAEHAAQGGLALAPIANQKIAVSDDHPKEAITPAQARVEAVSNVLHKAYEKASTLQLTPEESQALLADFQDSDFRTGASGKENLIYIEHAALRSRMNQVFGLGQWSLVVRNRWGEDYEYFDSREHTKKKACRIYVEACLLVRGCFVAEAIGDMVYYPANQQTNYGDAVEGAKSAALRRCAKELGIGLQAWRKDFCESWMAKHAGKRPAPPQVSTPKPTPAAFPPPKPAATETPEQKKARWVKACLDAAGGQKTYVIELFIEAGWILDNEDITDISETAIPKTKAEATKILDEIRNRAGVAEPPTEEPPQSEPAPDPEPEPDSEKVQGYVAVVTSKPTKKGGTRYGICVTQERDQREGGVWISTFDDKDGKLAMSLKGKPVVCYCYDNEFGKQLQSHGIKEEV